MKPPIPITDQRFAYTPSHATDLRAKFAKVREQMAQQEAHARAGIMQIKRERKA